MWPQIVSHDAEARLDIIERRFQFPYYYVCYIRVNRLIVHQNEKMKIHAIPDTE